MNMGGCQNCDLFLGTLNTRCRIIIGIQKGTIIMTTTHMDPVTVVWVYGAKLGPRRIEISALRIGMVDNSHEFTRRKA